jgi:hypothetical protein
MTAERNWMPPRNTCVSLAKNQINEKLCKKWKTMVCAELLVGGVNEGKLKTVFCRRLI